jgi:hypothetical protein
VPEQLTQSSQPTSLVPSSVMSYGVKVSMMSVAKLSNEKNPDDTNEKVSVALLSVSSVCNETKPEVPNSQDFGVVIIANTKLYEHSTKNSPLKRKFNILNNACTLVSKFSEFTESNPPESEINEV